MNIDKFNKKLMDLEVKDLYILKGSIEGVIIAKIVFEQLNRLVIKEES